MKTIAIIDDDIYTGDMLMEVLTQEGYKLLYHKIELKSKLLSKTTSAPD